MRRTLLTTIYVLYKLVNGCNIGSCALNLFVFIATLHTKRPALEKLQIEAKIPHLVPIKDGKCRNHDEDAKNSSTETTSNFVKKCWIAGVMHPCVAISIIVSIIDVCWCCTLN